MKKGNMLDQYMNDSVGVTDLSWIGTNTNNNTDEEVYLCSDCNVALIEKKDDIAHLGMDYNRRICAKCGFIYDSKKVGDIDNVKHAESIHTLTDSDTNATEPYIECIGAKSDDDFEREDALDNFDKNEMQELRQHGMIIKDVVTITRSSVDGRIKEEHIEE